MAYRDNPYGNFNFLVDVGTGDTGSFKAGFQEVTGLSMEVTSAEYRNGNEKLSSVRKMSGMTKYTDATLKRGYIGILDLYAWFKATSDGGQGRDVKRTVTIQLQNEARSAIVMTWKLINARPLRYTPPTFNAKTGTDVAMEELVIAYEDLAITLE